MNLKIHYLADKALGVMCNAPSTGFFEEGMIDALNCSKIEVAHVFALLRSRGYVRKDNNNAMFVTNEGGDFFLSGGFKELIEREKLVKENIIAGIRAADTADKISKRQRKIAMWTLFVAIITCIALIVQIILAISGKPVIGESVPFDNVEFVEDTINGHLG